MPADVNRANGRGASAQARLAGGFCMRPAQRASDYTTSANTARASAPTPATSRPHSPKSDAKQLARDAEERGWIIEADRAQDEQPRPHRRGEHACADLAAACQPVTFTPIAVHAGIGRGGLYRDPGLRALVDSHRLALPARARSLVCLSDDIAALRTAIEAVAVRASTGPKNKSGDLTATRSRPAPGGSESINRSMATIRILIG